MISFNHIPYLTIGAICLRPKQFPAYLTSHLLRISNQFLYIHAACIHQRRAMVLNDHYSINVFSTKKRTSLMLCLNADINAPTNIAPKVLHKQLPAFFPHLDITSVQQRPPNIKYNLAFQP